MARVAPANMSGAMFSLAGSGLRYNRGMATPTTDATTAPATILPVLGEYIAVKPGHCGGKPHIVGHRIKVQHIALWHERMGMTPREIVAQHPTLSLAAVHAALAYYHDHRAEIDADLRAAEEAAERFRAQQPSVLEKVAARRPDVVGLSSAAAVAYVRSGYCPPEDVERLRADLPRRQAAAPDDPDLAELAEELRAGAPG